MVIVKEHSLKSNKCPDCTQLVAHKRNEILSNNSYCFIDNVAVFISF